MTGKTETGGTTEELPEVAARSWAHPIANVPSDLTVRERHRLEAARSAVHGLFAQVEAVEVDVAAVQRMLDTVEKVPLQAVADGSIDFFALYNAMT